ncbi:MAG: ABC-F family ATP-binding cassette domain-containing protein [Bacteroidetes bacterium]|nr:ABC-F family ATP-binding cassette domain-containing protein [Bacteroidota bacterium]
MLAGFQDLVFEFGARVIVEDATWHIHPGERIGLIGFNGTGKSTLLKLLAGEYQPSNGTVERSRSTSIGYLHQDLLSFETGSTILEVAKTAFERVLEVQSRLEVLGLELEQSEDEKKLMEYTDLLHEMDVFDGYSIDHKTEDVLHGLGFSQHDLSRPYKEFSGGWRMRVLLAKMILMQPDLLMLDEPTNHLDLPSIEWLEKYLSHYQGAVVIVSHDKFFLNRMVNKVVELYQRRLHIYSGNYSYYESEKALRLDLQQRAFQNQQDFIRQQERFIERFKAKASKATQAQSVQKRLDKLDRVEEAVIERPNIRINFSVDKVPGKVICTLNNINKQFGDIRILTAGTGEIERGDKIALIGANGKGKSTLLRIIADRETFEGERKWGHNVDESFYAQHQLEHLRLDNTVLEEMQTAGSNKTDLELRTVLGCFLFSGEDVDKRIRVLSGGEKARVALAKTIISKANFLMLDEPTNHLDMHSVDLLAEALDKYEGSLILVSHDRYFISRTANKIWEIVDEKIVEFKGTYAEWVEWKERMRSQIQEKKENKPEKKEPIVKPVPTSVDKEKQKERKKLQKQFDDVEARVNQLKKEKSEIEYQLGNPEMYTQKDQFTVLEKKYQTTITELQSAEKEYERLFELLMDTE